MNPIALTRREQEVVDLVCIGFSNKQVAQYLAISEVTVKFYLNKIYRRLSIRSRPALAALVKVEGTLPMAAQWACHMDDCTRFELPELPDTWRKRQTPDDQTHSSLPSDKPNTPRARHHASVGSGDRRQKQRMEDFT